MSTACNECCAALRPNEGAASEAAVKFITAPLHTGPNPDGFVQEYIEARGGEVRVDCPLKAIELNPDDSVKGFRMIGTDGQPGRAPDSH
eukprot:1194735-Prorocentrum_minimum.AAC.8